MLGPVTRQSFVRTLNPRGPVWMRSQDFGLSECPFYITQPPLPPQKKHTLTHNQSLISMHTLPVKVLRTAFGHGLAWHQDGTERAGVNMYACVSSMYEKHAHTLSSRQVMHGVRVSEGGKQWKIRTGRGWFGLAGHMSISDSWHSIRLSNQCSHPALATTLKPD